ncbi:hypothetical protein A2257_01650 [Candidatus Falkowbacteria bacterium RIFOXYA2_FULL_38_12]|uniref:Uncharacterized protein n=1 Tax=Candidatus Falkowbacteria bacterium RIFOXYA2_FULL_38_12 TaxID=1797993 RepID=A0A1F5S3U7_9BACT|nr:MAG: hypothetical protein A2257_01650 [Candidatus Falkowbacteria bacterium RIFOXYA2_FULL_38_12]OGF42323.1 MAG: hypothetical protein A2555_04465 [Candidatus Falkowbacteria bacterium RIFOXYD2_FULL_39_16]
MKILNKKALISLGLLAILGLILIIKAPDSIAQNNEVKISGQLSSAIVINHSNADISKVPESYVTQAKTNLKVFYIHTSHGSQIISGMETLRNSLGSLYSFNSTGSGSSLKIEEEYGDLGSNGDLGWEYQVRDKLDQSGNNTNVVMISWCGGASENTTSGINAYLNAMNQLEKDYPNTTFVYMTGHLDGTGVNGNLNKMNTLIRNYANTNKKVLFDFADIESYDPSGSYFLNKNADDGANYSGGNWASEWCENNSGNSLCSSCECAHSEPLNCNLKGRAFWWMAARLAGWNGTSSPTPPSTPPAEDPPSTPPDEEETPDTTLSVVEQERLLVSWVDTALATRLSGRILLQIEKNGEAWYIYPKDKKKYYLGRPSDAFNVMRRLGLGATHQYISSHTIFPDSVLGKILLDVEKNGEAYYIYPINKKKYYLGRPQDAFNIMRSLGLGITNVNLRKIGVE